MDIRIGANSYGYPVRASQKSNSAAKTSFADLMKAKQADAIGSRDSVTITQKPLEQRLESVHQKIAEMDFTGKSNEEIYKSINDTYETEFGYLGIMFYTDRDTCTEIREDAEQMFEDKISNYIGLDEKALYYRAMGYDKMTDAEKVAAIKERVGGNTYVHKIAMNNEMAKADVISSREQTVIFRSLVYQAEQEYCAKYGLDYIDWKYNAGSKENAEYRLQKVMGWMAETEISWLDVLESVKDFPAMEDWQKEDFYEGFSGKASLLLGKEDYETYKNIEV